MIDDGGWMIRFRREHIEEFNRIRLLYNLLYNCREKDTKRVYATARHNTTKKDATT